MRSRGPDRTREGGRLSDLGHLAAAVNAVIERFHDVLAIIDRSSEGAKHLAQTVKDTAAQTSRTAGDISASAETVARRAVRQAEEAGGCLGVSGRHLCAPEEP